MGHNHMQGLHHIHKRIRAHKTKQDTDLKKFPSQIPKVKFIDKLVLFVATFGPLVTLPQVVKIYESKNAGGISTFTYSMILLMNVCWLSYGITHKDKPIINSSALFILFNSAILAGAILFA